MAQRKPVIPPLLILIDGFGCVVLVLGVMGLMGQMSALPALGIPLVAWTLTIIGALTVIAALGLIVFHLLNAARSSRNQSH